MRVWWILFAGAVGCATLPDFPEVEPEPDWTCTAGFTDAAKACQDADCPGLFSMYGVIGDREWAFASEDIALTIKQGDDGTLRGVEIDAITAYFRSHVHVGSLDITDDETHRALRILPADQAPDQDNAATLWWSLSNSTDPFVSVGQRGLLTLDRDGDWLRIVFVVGDHEDNDDDVGMTEGCGLAKMPGM